MKKKYVWVVEKYDGLKIVAQYTIPSGQITEENLKHLMRTLAAKHELTDEEIIPCFLKKNTKKYWDYLEVKHGGKAKYYSLYCQGKMEIMALCVPEEKLKDVLKTINQREDLAKFRRSGRAERNPTREIGTATIKNA